MENLTIQEVAPPAYTDFVLPFWQAARNDGQRCAILTIIGSTGSSPRPVGSQLAVREDGLTAGLLSGGCIESALVLDALRAIRTRTNYIERYGAGSRFIDLRLPCGSGIDIYFDTAMPDAIGNDILDRLAARQPVNLLIDTINHQHRLMDDTTQHPSQLIAGQYIRNYLPMCKLVIAGSGQILVSLAELCRASEIEVEIATTDRQTLKILQATGFDCQWMPRWSSHDWSALDRWTALAILTHDHDDEADILAPALASNAFYIGALGSRKTQTNRVKSLQAMGLSETTITRIKGPIGIPIGAATPPEIAVSVLAELISHWRQGPARNRISL